MSTCNQHKNIIHAIFYIPFIVPGCQNPVCIPHSWHVAISTGHISMFSSHTGFMTPVMDCADLGPSKARSRASICIDPTQGTEVCLIEFLQGWEVGDVQPTS